MKLHRFTFLASLFLTAVMIAIAFIFDVSKENFFQTRQKFYITVIFTFMVMLVINYIVLEFLFAYYGKRQIQKISTILPNEFVGTADSSLNLRTLGEKVSEMQEKSASEIDTMKEMETYRKDYIGNVSHEMKTPLFSIQGYVETLMDGGVEDLNIRDKYLDRINKSVERLLNIVTDLDMINKYESGEINLNLSRFDINALVREVFDLLDLEAEKKSAKLTLQPSHAQIFVMADKQKISQVLINLISNAIDYSNRSQAQITVTTRNFRSKVEIEVKDNGMGIKPEILPRIFERFFRVENSRSRKEGGSGLGLAIVKHILEAHHENIIAESIYLEGTTFRFSLPVSY